MSINHTAIISIIYTTLVPRSTSVQFLCFNLIYLLEGTEVSGTCSWVRHCATCRKVKGSIPDYVIDMILPAAL